MTVALRPELEGSTWDVCEHSLSGGRVSFVLLYGRAGIACGAHLARFTTINAHTSTVHTKTVQRSIARLCAVSSSFLLS